MFEVDALHKLIMLYISNKLKFPLTEEQLFDFLISNDYAGYFKCKQDLSNLLKINYLKSEKTESGRTFYTITESGSDSIKRLKTIKISKDLQKEIDDFLKEKGLKYNDENSTPCYYMLNANRSYDVTCKIIDNDETLMSITVSVPTEDQALKVRENWRKNKNDLFKMVMEKLI